MSRDIFSKDFKPYIQRTKGFYAKSGSKKTWIPTHYSYCTQSSVRPIDFKSVKDRRLFYQMKRKNRIFYDD